MNKVEYWREKCYADVPKELYMKLQQFRSRYPYKRILIDGQEWRYIITDGGSDTILMLPGSTATGESNWREIPRFSSDYRVLSISYPPVKSVESLFKGILTIIDTEKIELMNILGASMGGAIGHWFIRNYPQRIKKLIIFSLGMPDRTTSKTLNNVASFFSCIPSPLIRRIFERESAKLVSVLPADEAKLMTAYFRDMYRYDIDKRTIICHFRLSADIAANVFNLGLDKPFVESQPVLIINAVDDESISPEARNALIATYPNAQTFLFPSGGHTLFGRREELFKIINEFIRR